MRKIALRLAVLAALIYAAFAATMIWAHRSYIYPFSSRAETLDSWQRLVVETAGAAPLVAYETGKGSDPTVLFFMGNAGSLAHFGPWLAPHQRARRRLVAMTYRGGGGQQGVPTEARLKADALALYDHVAGQGPVVLHGYSLGSGLALHVAARRPVAGVVLEAPYARLCSLMAQATNLPACLMPVDRWDSLADVAAVTAPVMILHGQTDAVIPIAQAETLVSAFHSAGKPVTFRRFAEAGHLNLPEMPGYDSLFEEFIAGLARQAP